MVDWKVRNLDEGEINNFLEWRNLVARRRKNLKYIKWEYFKGPWGAAKTSIADYNGKIIGQYSTQNYEAFYFGEKIMASLSFDTATHPDFRRQGIFRALGTHHFNEQGKQNIYFSTGFPNENFWPGGKKFNWHGLCTVPLFENNNVSNLKIEKATKFELQKINKFDNDFLRFSDNFKDDIPIYLNRTMEYLKWRFVEKPSLEDPKYDYNYSKYKILDKTGEMVSYIVTKIFHTNNQRILHLVDFLIPKEQLLYQIIVNLLIKESRAQKINIISLFIDKYHPFREFLNKNDFKFVDTNRVFIVRINNDVLDKRIIYDEKNHYITMADSDVI